MLFVLGLTKLSNATEHQHLLKDHSMKSITIPIIQTERKSSTSPSRRSVQSSPSQITKPPSLSPQSPNLVFVYGSLKQGERNHNWLSYTDAVKLPGFYQTLIEWPLVICGLPFLLALPSRGLKVKGEVYEVSRDGLRVLDGFEGHPNGYNRQTILVHRLGESGGSTKVFSYLYPHDLSRLVTLEPVSWYTRANQPEPS